MISQIDDTHDPTLTCWVDSANDPTSDFPIQNLPFGRFRRAGEARFRIGVAIGDQVADLEHARLIATDDMNGFMRAGATARRALRHTLSNRLRAGSPHQGLLQTSLVPMSAVEMGLPCHIGDYTDFYTSIHHAMSVGRQFRPDNPLLPNYKWVPIGYHGRASSIGISGQTIVRPRGQFKGPDDETPRVGPTRRLDYELELGIFIGTGNAQGEAIPIADAEAHLFGITLFNDWTARDIQAWEYQPLSPWVVTMEALAPFRCRFTRSAGDPEPLPYLDSPHNRSEGAIDIALEVWLQTATMRTAGTPPERLMQSNFRDSYWTLAQLVAHHTVNGCNLEAGDLLGSGTQSGPAPGQGGSMLELSNGGKHPLQLADGQMRSFLEDGDTVILRGHCARPEFRRIGFGDCAGTIVPASA